MNNSTENVLQCTKLTKVFSQGSLLVNVFDQISFCVAPGETLAIVGSSGAGKSTLLHLLGGLDKPTSGEVLIEGNDLYAMTENQRSQLRNQCLGFVYQFHHLLPEFNALENVCMPLLIRGLNSVAAKEQAADIIERVGLSARLEHRVGELSGGERQRIALARALVTHPRIILADEPTGNLDYKTAQQVLALMLELNESLNTSFMVVTHNLELAGQMDRTLLLQDGSLIQKVS